MPNSKRRVDRIDAKSYMPLLRAEAPRLLRYYGSYEKVADHLKLSRKDALNLILMALEERKPLQRRAGRRAAR